MSFNLRLNYGSLIPTWDLQFYELLCYKHPWFQYSEIIEKCFDIMAIEFWNPLYYMRLQTWLFGSWWTMRLCLKVDFFEMSTDNLKGVVFSNERVSYYGFLPLKLCAIIGCEPEADYIIIISGPEAEFYLVITRPRFLLLGKSMTLLPNVGSLP